MDRLLVGAFPGSKDDEENKTNMNLLINEGITMFACLQAEVKL